MCVCVLRYCRLLQVLYLLGARKRASLGFDAMQCVYAGLAGERVCVCVRVGVSPLASTPYSVLGSIFFFRATRTPA